ncbi:DUF5954 family protein [Streptomyces sp. NPDC059534]|uniref:DUF5954 family protein n=1 Tax=Streptomyces sp. NPDC059534 TaxID=3346859 RepID=UPI00368E9483
MTATSAGGNPSRRSEAGQPQKSVHSAEWLLKKLTVVAENASPTVAELAVFAKASDRLRAGRCNEVEVLGTVSRIGRVRRLLRWGPDSPEPRPRNPPPAP